MHCGHDGFCRQAGNCDPDGGHGDGPVPGCGQRSDGIPAPDADAPGAGPGAEILERIELQIVIKNGEKSKQFQLEGFRKRFLRQGEIPIPGAPGVQP